MLTILTHVRQYHIRPLTRSSLILIDAEHLLMCFLATSMSSLEKCPFKSCASIWLGFFSLILRYISCLCVLEISASWMSFLQILVTFWGLSFFFVFMVSSALPSLLREIQSQLLFFHDSNRWVKKELAAFYVKICFAFFPQEFHIIILLFRSLLGVYFCVCY